MHTDSISGSVRAPPLFPGFEATRQALREKEKQLTGTHLIALNGLLIFPGDQQERRLQWGGEREGMREE